MYWQLTRRGLVAVAAGSCALFSDGSIPEAAFARENRFARNLATPKCVPTACSVPAAAPTLVLNTGGRIPAIGFGTYLSNGDELFAALVHALRNGYRHIDTAAGYFNEPVVADAIEASGVPREQIFITTKLWCSDHGRKRTQRAIAQSLRALRTDYIDLYLVHAPDNQGSTPEEVRRLRKESWEVMEEAHAAGTLRAIGVSNFEPRHIEALLVEDSAPTAEAGERRASDNAKARNGKVRADAAARPRAGAVVPAVNQIELHPLLEQREVLEYCARRGIVVEAYGAVGAGAVDQPQLVKVAEGLGRTPAQVSLRHTLQRSPAQVVVLAKSLTPARIDENLRIFDFEIDQEDIATLDALAKKDGRSYWDNSDVP